MAARSPQVQGGEDEPRKVFSDGPWLFEETGQRFSGADLDEAAFAAYRATPQRAPGVDDEIVEVLKWAVPLAERAVEDHRMRRIEAGHHDIRGTYKSGETWGGIHQHEVNEIERARALLRRLASGPSGVDGEASYTAEEVAEAMEVLRGRHGSTALVDEVLDEMERVLLAAAAQDQGEGRHG